jgi:hypothetical protein
MLVQFMFKVPSLWQFNINSHSYQPLLYVYSCRLLKPYLKHFQHVFNSYYVIMNINACCGSISRLSIPQKTVKLHSKSKLY